MNIFTFELHNRNSSEGILPLYQQVYAAIRQQIEQKNLHPHERLPSKRQLAQQLNISQNTVEAAYQQLVDEGYLYSRERSGFFVAAVDNLMPAIQVAQTNKGDSDCNTEGCDKADGGDLGWQGVDAVSFPHRLWRKLAWQILSQPDSDLIHLGHPQGYLPLRQSICTYLHQSRGVQTQPDRIIISAGTEYLFDIILRILPADRVIGIEDPGYARLKFLFEQNRIAYCPIPLDSQGVSLQKAREKGVHVLSITPSHQFPTGLIYPIQRRQQLLQWAAESSERCIIEDDYDSEFKYAGKPILALKAMDTHDQVIYLGSFSKSISPALRISFMVLPQKLLQRWQHKIPYLLCPVPTLTQKVLHRFIEDGHFNRHLNKMRTRYKKRRELLVQQFKQRSPKLHIRGSDAGLHLILDFSDFNSTEEHILSAVQDFALPIYGMSQYAIQKEALPYRSAVLLGYGSIGETNIEELVKKLCQAWFKSCSDS